MPYEDDEMRRAARERLAARMERRGSAHALASNSARQSSSGRADGRAAAAAGQRGGTGPAPAGESRAASALRDVAERIGATARQSGTAQRPGAARGGSTARLGSANAYSLGPVTIPLPDFVPPIAVPIAAAVIALLIVFGLIIPSCTRAPEPQGAQSAQSAAAQADESGDGGEATASGEGAASGGASASEGTVAQVVQAKEQAQDAVEHAGQVASVDTGETHQAALEALLGDETAAKLLAAAKTSPEALWIAAHPGAYAFDGVEVQYKVLKLAADEPQAVGYVRGFPSSYPADGASSDKSLAMDSGSPSSGVPDTGIPHLYQWDRRWGYTTYSSAAFGLTGCGPTSLAMVYQGITGKSDKTPADMAKLAEEGGFMAQYDGTAGEFFTAVAEELGLYCEEMYPEAEAVSSALAHGHTVIANLAPGYFTSNGHFFVLAGLDEDGKVIVNDPYSVERSSQTWDLDLIVSESYTMYSYSRAI